MLYYLSQFESVISELGLFQYITVRTLCAAATGFVIMLLISPCWIYRLRGRSILVSKKWMSGLGLSEKDRSWVRQQWAALLLLLQPPFLHFYGPFQPIAMCY